MRQVLLLLYPTFSEFEVTVATAVLRASRQLVTIALDEGPVTSEAGYRVLPDATVAAVDPDACDALIVPGGDVTSLMEAQPLFALVRALAEREALLAAICAGPYVLARAGLLRDRPSTVGFTREQRRFLGCFAEEGYRPEAVVEDGRVVTAQGQALVEFGLRVGERLGAAKNPAVRAFYTGQLNPAAD